MNPKPVILIVDDERLNRRLLARMLTRLGVEEIDEATDGLFTVCLGKQGITGKRLLVGFDASKIHAPFQGAQVLHPCDDFLSGITAFFEAYAVHQLQVGHLRHK